MTGCIIVEDEALARDVIIRHLKAFPEYELLGACRNGPEAEQALRDLPVDLMFLDIRLPGMSGMELIAKLTNPPLIILTTAYSEYAVESYAYNVIDYLLKPISFERFSKAMEKIADGRLVSAIPRGETAMAPEFFFVRSGTKYYRVDFDEILYIQGMRDYVKIHTGSCTLLTHQTMNDIESQLPASRFIRIHKSYIIAIRQIRSVYGNTVETGNLSIPVGSNYKERLMRLLRAER